MEPQPGPERIMYLLDYCFEGQNIWWSDLYQEGIQHVFSFRDLLGLEHGRRSAARKKKAHVDTEDKYIPSEGRERDSPHHESITGNPIPSLPSVKPALRQEINFHVFQVAQMNQIALRAGQRLRDYVSLTAHPLFFC